MNITDFPKEIVERAKQIRLLALDVDGVLSDGKLIFSNTGDELKTFSTLDGQGIKMLQRCGIEVAIITGRSSQIVANRAANLGINQVVQGREDKLTALGELLKNSDITHEQIAYMGDDLPDLAVIRKVGLGLTPANGHWSVKAHAHWQTQLAGGEGAVREACDLILLSQGRLDAELAAYL